MKFSIINLDIMEFGKLHWYFLEKFTATVGYLKIKPVKWSNIYVNLVFDATSSTWILYLRNPV